MIYFLIAVLSFGVLIAVHEFGHFVAAKACGVRVNEFSIGMGPRLLHSTKGETEYSLRLFPIGGFCAMEGEEEESDDERALFKQKKWKQLIIFAAGAAMNFLTGFLIITFLYAGASGFYTAEIAALEPEFPQQGENGIMVGDTIYAINGERVYYRSNVSFLMDLVVGEDDSMEMTVLRDGEKHTCTLTKQLYKNEDGTERLAYGFSYGGMVEANPLVRLKYSWYQTIDYVRLVRLSLKMMFSGSVGMQDLSGPIGIVSTITEGGKEVEETDGFAAAMENVLFFVAMIAINLAVMNLLPFPALDGGHILFLFASSISMLLFRREIPRKYLNVINGIGFALLMALMLYVAVQDTIRLF